MPASRWWEVVDLKRLAVTAEIPAAEAAALKTGAEAQVVAEPPVTATLSFVSPTVDEKNGTVLVRALLPENNGLRPGQFVQFARLGKIAVDEFEKFGFFELFGAA